MRNQLSATPPGVSGPDFAGCVPSLRAVVEAYPNLKSDAAFLALQQQLIEPEQRIALARAYFNESRTPATPCAKKSGPIVALYL